MDLKNNQCLIFFHWSIFCICIFVNAFTITTGILLFRSITTNFVFHFFTQVLVLSRVSEYSPNFTRDKCQEDEDGILNIHSLPSNLYSRHELQLLSWLNSHYHHMREKVWASGIQRPHGLIASFAWICFLLIFEFLLMSGTVPPVRWIVNFDLDLIDGLVLAALLATYCPYLVSVCWCNYYYFFKAGMPY